MKFLQTTAALALGLSLALTGGALAAPKAGGGGGGGPAVSGGGGGGGGPRIGGGGGGGPRMGAGPRAGSPSFAGPRAGTGRHIGHGPNVSRGDSIRVPGRTGSIDGRRHWDGGSRHHHRHGHWRGGRFYAFPLYDYGWDNAYYGSGCGYYWRRWERTGNPVWKARYYDCID